MNKEKISQLINNYKENMIKDLTDFVCINSVYDESSIDEANPFGKGVSEALDFFYTIAKRDGFEVTNYGNYCVEITYGEGPGNITPAKLKELEQMLGESNNE
jgi:succinyl-diaminopimelate desuccinylase